MTDVIQPRKPGRPRGSQKPIKDKKAEGVWVRMTPAVFAYLKHIHQTEGFSYSDTSRALMLEAMRARGVFPAVAYKGE